MPPDCKKKIRQEMRALRASQNPLVSKYRSKLAEAHILASPLWQKARSIGFYAPLPGEADCRGLLQAAWTDAKTAYLPKIVDVGNRLMEFAPCSGMEELTLGPLNIIQPITPVTIHPEMDLLILPGLAFDLKGTRLGYGGGYYDKYLEAHPGFAGALLGFCHHFQLLDALPSEAWDVPMHLLCSEQGMLEINQKA